MKHIFSMTGFGRATDSASRGQIVVEIQSVNRKQLEIHFVLPKRYSSIENDLRKQITETVSRGSVSVRVTLQGKAGALLEQLPDVKALKALKKGWEAIALELGFSKQEISLSFLAEKYSPETAVSPLEKQESMLLQKCLSKALQNFRAMQQKEGAALAKDIQTRLDLIAKHTDAIEKASPNAVQTMRHTLKKRLEDLLGSSAPLDERLGREIALYAEKLDISEELTRLRSHLDQFQSKEMNSGRKMEFLLQELGREINTIGSKSMDVKISHRVVEVKGEIEKIREQVQNIE
ncbi:MAG TPA: YicC/YloC family endoribonuclease [Chlamydiales bacterium]|jgi:uncharacterized protein (TIGR00255 family)